MFKTITDLIPWSKSSVKDEWCTWTAWQNCQNPSHYERSNIFHYYLTSRPIFRPQKNACHQNKHYVYCFGDFSALLVTPSGGENALEYLVLLVDVYDVCKGVSRKFITGDPPCITLLREVIRKRSLNALQSFDFYQYEYPYGEIHAHTVAQYSLSTLLMRFVSHYMSYVDIRKSYPAIEIGVCQKACSDCVFGTPIFQTSSPIGIPCKPKLDEIRGSSSWPMDNKTCLRCVKCKRVTENIWGDFDCCLDCHSKRICSVCGEKAIIISTDDLPKCNLHKPGD